MKEWKLIKTTRSSDSIATFKAEVRTRQEAIQISKNIRCNKIQILTDSNRSSIKKRK